MILLQMVPTPPKSPVAADIRVLATTDVYSPEELQFWRQKRWLVMENQGRTVICNVRSDWAEDRSTVENFGVRWTLTPKSPGKVVFYFSGLRPTKSSRTIRTKDEVSYVEFKTRRGSIAKRPDRHRVHGVFKGGEFRLEWRETIQDSNPSQVTLFFGGRTQVLGTIRPFSGFSPLWVGDLDGDGRLDLLVKSEGEKGDGNVTLFLGVDDPTNLVVTAFTEDSQGE
ncbi:MAG TPA: FG-GAP repeat protein [Holophagaceae bacterium]|nr:FG-GAP repeat protein [Holophagaceae bacterium]